MEKQRVKLKDLAKELNVSITTISKALNNHPDISEARKKEILALVEERNYIPNRLAKGLRTDSSAFIGVIVSDNYNPYNSKVIKAMENVATREGFYLLIANTNEQIDLEEQIIKKMLAINVSGVLLCPAMGNKKTVELLRKHDVPYVLFNRYINKDEDSYVVANDTLAARLGTECLLKNFNGGRMIFIAPDLKISTAHDRLIGFQEALASKGIPFEEQCFFHDVVDYDDGYAVLDRITERFPNDDLSILCYSDYIALGVMKRLFEKQGLMERRVSIMGIDGVEMFSTFLTSIHLPKYSLGLRSTEMLINKIRYNSEERRIVMSEGIQVMGSSINPS